MRDTESGARQLRRGELLHEATFRSLPEAIAIITYTRHVHKLLIHIMCTNEAPIYTI